MFALFQQNGIEIWVTALSGALEFPVYGVSEGDDPRVCPSIGMALDVAGISGPLARTITTIIPDELKELA